MMMQRPSKPSIQFNENNYLQQNLTAKRTYIITSGGILLTLGSKLIDYSGAGPLATMTSAFIASECWKKNDSFSVSINNVNRN